MTRDQLAVALLNPNVRAFLRLIRAGESAQTDDAYRWLFGSTVRSPKLFASFDDHPRVRTYEKNDEFIKNGKADYTTAAGAFQITETTFNALCKQYGFSDFTPQTQELMAVALIAERNARVSIIEGRIQPAIAMCCRTWASLPGSPWGQTTNSFAHAQATYLEFGGVLAGTAPQPEPAAPVPEPAAPVPEAKPPVEGKPMLPLAIPAAQFAWGLASSLIDLFTPLAKEKITKEIARHTDNPEVANSIVDGILTVAKAATGKADPIEAVVAAKANPTIIQAVESDTMAALERMAPFLDKLAAIDRDQWAAEEASRTAAAERMRLDPNNQDRFLTKAIVLLLVGVMVVVAALVALLIHLKADAGTIGTLVGLFTTIVGVIGGKFGTRYDYAYGSSKSSGAKDVLIQSLSKGK